MKKSYKNANKLTILRAKMNVDCEELKRLTGFKTTGPMRRWLKKEGIPFKSTPVGGLFTTQAALDAVLVGKPRQTIEAGGPDYEKLGLTGKGSYKTR